MHKVTITPTAEEVNLTGHVGFSVIPTWLQKGFEHVFALVNSDGDINKGPLIVARLEVDYLAEVFGDQAVTLESGVAQVGKSSFVLQQKLVQGGKTVASARVTMVYFLYGTRKSAPIPEHVRQKLEKESLQHSSI